MSQKIIYLGKEVRDSRGRYTSFKKIVRKAVRTTIKAFIWFVVLYGAMVFGMFVLRDSSEVTVQADENIPPVLQRIFNCESKGQQFGKSGQVLVSPNTNGTVDMGIGQINTVWFSKASELGLDLTKEKDNKAMAMWIYENKGTGPWSSSAKCWNK
jgi:hypothetical protein